MDAAHLHLMITHLPIFGSILGLFVLLFGMAKNSSGAKLASYWLFIISAIGAAISYATGEGAEEKVEDLPGVMESIIEQHENFALYALVSLIVLGAASFLAMLANKGGGSFAKTTGISVLLLAIVSFGLVARTGYLGGQIRHTEIRSGAVSIGVDGQQNEEKARDDDD